MEAEIKRNHQKMMRDTRSGRLLPAAIILATSIGLAVAFVFGSLWLEVFVYLGLTWVVWFGIKAAFLAGVVAAYNDASKRFEEIQAEVAREHTDWAGDAGNTLRVVGPS